MLAGALVIEFAIVQRVLLSAFRDLQESAAQRHLDRLEEAAAADRKMMETVVKDWGWWDEMVAYVAKPFKAFEVENLPNSYWRKPPAG